MNCLSCKSTKLELIDSFSKQELIDLYKNDSLLNPGLNIEQEITGPIDLYHCGHCDLKMFDPPVMGSEKFYDDLRQFEWYYKPSKPEFALTKKFIKPTDRVLEIGSGVGAYGKEMANYTGLEFNPDAVIQAQTEGINVINQSIERHAELNIQYDCVVAHQVLEHVADTYSFVQAAKKCLKPHGFLIFSVPNEDSFLADLQNFALNMPPHHVTKWSKQSLKNLASIHGLRLHSLIEEDLDPFHKKLNWQAKSVKFLNRLFGVKHSLIQRKTHLVSNLISNAIYRIANALIPSKAVGHTIIAVYYNEE
jgi:2-polyprenyl-3-methyl-5-hydroxy-6-metoxy-1,4-benzoquinol methylase